MCRVFRDFRAFRVLLVFLFLFVLDLLFLCLVLFLFFLERLLFLDEEDVLFLLPPETVTLTVELVLPVVDMVEDFVVDRLRLFPVSDMVASFASVSMTGLGLVDFVLLVSMGDVIAFMGGSEF